MLNQVAEIWNLSHTILINKCHTNTQSHSGMLETGYALAKASEWFPEKVQKSSGGTEVVYK